MGRAWYMDKSEVNPKLEHHRSPPEFISLQELYKKTGVEYFALNSKEHDTDGVLDRIKSERGYTYETEMTLSKETLPNYNEIMNTIFVEHLHDEEEVRFILDGSSYFDVRDGNDEWIRIEALPGDLIIIPSGIYHRCTLDAKNFVRGKCLYEGTLKGKPYNRPSDDFTSRQKYLEKLKQGFTNNH